MIEINSLQSVIESRRYENVCLCYQRFGGFGGGLVGVTFGGMTKLEPERRAPQTAGNRPRAKLSWFNKAFDARRLGGATILKDRSAINCHGLGVMDHDNSRHGHARLGETTSDNAPVTENLSES
ncbi:hypothetical protein [Salinicola socius]|uniref:hypothetical protein n=1 Tax=Salinicola socius TaxID=404433 RepID=UPI0011838472|nr:hypothetical protein [Salinicola socius]